MQKSQPCPHPYYDSKSGLAQVPCELHATSYLWLDHHLNTVPKDSPTNTNRDTATTTPGMVLCTCSSHRRHAASPEVCRQHGQRRNNCQNITAHTPTQDSCWWYGNKCLHAAGCICEHLLTPPALCALWALSRGWRLNSTQFTASLPGR